jgi:hypothetical protein
MRSIAHMHPVDCSPPSGSFTVRTSQDVIGVSACTNFTGDISILPEDFGDIILNGIITITGKLQAHSTETSKGLYSLSSPTLRSVSELNVEDLSNLSSLSFPAIGSLSTLQLRRLPSLQNCTISGGPLSPRAKNITVSNTSLKDLDWLVWPNILVLNVFNNPNLTSFRIPGTTIGNGSAYSISNNGNLKDVDVSKITKLDGLLSLLAVPAISALQFQDLQDLSGTVRLSGNFTNITMPALPNINGQIHANSTRNIGDFCHELELMPSSNKHYTCNSFSSDQRTQTLDIEMSQASTSQLDGSLFAGSNPVKTLAILTAPLLVCIIVLVLFACIYNRRSRNKKVRGFVAKTSEVEKRRSPTTLAELWSPSETLELGTGKEAQEMNGRGLLECGGESVKECGGESVKELDANGWNAVRGSLYSVGCAGRRNSV